jgi:hypothetical protein
LNWGDIKNEKTIVYDVKGFLNRSEVTSRL